jgi:hypothetical protein
MIAKLKPQERHLKKERTNAAIQYKKSYNDAENAKKDFKDANVNLENARRRATSAEEMDNAMDKVNRAEMDKYYSELDRDRKSKNLQDKKDQYNTSALHHLYWFLPNLPGSLSSSFAEKAGTR